MNNSFEYYFHRKSVNPQSVWLREESQLFRHCATAGQPTFEKYVIVIILSFYHFRHNKEILVPSQIRIVGIRYESLKFDIVTQQVIGKQSVSFISAGLALALMLR